jgi:ParB-like chromosome segregation protein Spo0J
LKPVLLDLPPGTLRPNPWNTNVVSPDHEAKLQASVNRLGMFKPVLVRQLDDGTYEILGGEHRARAAMKNGDETVPVLNLGEVSDEKAKEIGLVDNARYGNDDTLQLAALLKDLGSVDDLSTFMPYTDAEFASIFAASSIALDELGLDDEASPSALATTAAAPQTHAVMRFKVPVEDAESIAKRIEAVMKAQKFVTEDSLTNAGNALVWLLARAKS